MKISILIPTKNRLELLKDAVYTVLSQSDDNLELIIADNCSNQDIKSYIESLSDERVVYIRSDVPLSVTDNWNRALKACSGAYVLMLGDDDGLTPGYIKRLRHLISEYKNIDFIYQGAYIYGFPGAIKGIESGFLYEAYKDIKLLQGKKNHQKLEKSEAEAAAKESIKMNLVFPFNMQHFVYKADFIKKMDCYGDFFQSPFPDFYAGTITMLLAKDVVLWNSPQVIIGISQKSFGHFYFNRIEKEGVKFLDIGGYEKKLPKSISKYWLPLSHMENAWLVSMNEVLNKFPNRQDLNLDIKSYQRKQLAYLLSAPLSFGNIKLFFSIWPRVVGKRLYVRMIAKQLLKKLLLSKEKKFVPFSGVTDLNKGWKNLKEVFNGIGMYKAN